MDFVSPDTTSLQTTAIPEEQRVPISKLALAITAANNVDAARAMEELDNLKGSEAHSTIILTDEDKNVLRKLGINVTFDPYYQYDKLYRK